jgi:hypothetical protein
VSREIPPEFGAATGIVTALFVMLVLRGCFRGGDIARLKIDVADAARAAQAAKLDAYSAELKADRAMSRADDAYRIAR